MSQARIYCQKPAIRTRSPSVAHVDICRLKAQYEDNTLLEELQGKIDNLEDNIVNMAITLQIGCVPGHD